MPGRVVVCGNIVFDILTRPVEEVRWGATVVVDSVVQTLGGNAGTTSYTIGKLGVPVSIATLVGRDATGETVLRYLETARVDLSMVRYVDAPTSIAVALIRANGDRALLYQLGAASEDFPVVALPEDAVHFHLAAVYRMRHLREIGPSLLKGAREAGLATSLDAQWDTEGEWLKVLAPSLPWTDYTLLNEDEARMLTGFGDPSDAARVLKDLGAGNVIVKLGPRGCWVNGTVVPGHNVTAIDTTGAGDCFSGGFVAALQRGLGVEEAARFANAVGALAVQRIGATNGVRDWDTTIGWLRDRIKV